MNIQRAMYDYAVNKVRLEFPEWDDKQIEIEVGRRSAPPNAITPPPHLTGGAVDIDIIDENGMSLDLTSPYTITDWQQAPLFTTDLSNTAATNRRILKQALELSGLTNYADEWWHWSYGDNGWALRTGSPVAVYGLIDLPDNVHWIGDITKLPS